VDPSIVVTSDGSLVVLSLTNGGVLVSRDDGGSFERAMGLSREMTSVSRRRLEEYRRSFARVLRGARSQMAISTARGSSRRRSSGSPVTIGCRLRCAQMTT
jgi:hypothetical protein